jgi:hypothetical protein
MKAFPSSTQSKVWEDGMDLRDYFAIHATDNDIFKYQVSESGFKEIRTREEARYMFADEMMESRKK